MHEHVQLPANVDHHTEIGLECKGKGDDRKEIPTKQPFFQGWKERANSEFWLALSLPPNSWCGIIPHPPFAH